MSEGKIEIIPELLDSGFTFHIPTQPKPFIGHEAFRGFVGYLRNAFPDIKFIPENFVVDGNKVASRWQITGTHKGEFLGAQPTGNSISDFGIDIFTIHQGKILFIEVNENDFGLMQQLGIIPR
jgi:predicted ester cyclase